MRWLCSGFDGILLSKPVEFEEYNVRLYMNGTIKRKFMEINVQVR